jgi:hypothetical protein
VTRTGAPLRVPACRPLPGVAGALAADGYAVVRGPVLRSHLGIRGGEWAGFRAHWDDLVLDTYIGPLARDLFRYRRYARMALRCGRDGVLTLTPLPNQSFVQSADNVRLYGGKARTLAYATDSLCQDPVLHRLIATDHASLPHPPQTAEVGLHAIRVRVGAHLDSRPTPEGRHRDGHDHVAMHLIGRTGCTGGQTIVYPHGEPGAVATATLAGPLDTVLADDAAVDHEVTPLIPTGPSGHRDVLLVAFYPITDANTPGK